MSRQGDKAVLTSRAAAALHQQAAAMMDDHFETRDRVAAYHANLELRRADAPRKRSNIAELITKFCAWGA